MFNDCFAWKFCYKVLEPGLRSNLMLITLYVKNKAIPIQKILHKPQWYDDALRCHTSCSRPSPWTALWARVSRIVLPQKVRVSFVGQNIPDEVWLSRQVIRRFKDLRWRDLNLTPPFFSQCRDGRSINVFSETRPADCGGTLIQVRLVQRKYAYTLISAGDRDVPLGNSQHFCINLGQRMHLVPRSLSIETHPEGRWEW